MATPSTIIEFIDLVAKSNIMEKRSLDTYLQCVTEYPEQPGTPKSLAQTMVRDGILTHLQAGLILRGKWRNFIISGKYKLLEHLGTGGMGSVYLCEHVLMRRRVALKVLPNDKVNDPVILDRFYREARAVAALDHRNIVRAHDIDRDGDLHFLVLEYVDGSSLQHIVEKFGRLSVSRAVNIIRQTADGLQHAHQAGLVHRDIKPGNLLVDRIGVVKVLDLGLARFFDDENAQLSGPINKQTVLGTADYLAPEQAIDSSAVDIRGDIYSLGVTLYYLLTAQSPYSDGSLSQKLMWHQISTPKPLTEIRPEIPRKLATVIDKMMAKDPADRYQTPIEVYEALEAWDEGAETPPDHEMPQLSPAAMGGMSTNRLPAITKTSLSAVNVAQRPDKTAKKPGWFAKPRNQTVWMVFGVVLAGLAGAAAAVIAANH